MDETNEAVRLLVVTDDPGGESVPTAALEELAEGRELELKVVAPIRPPSNLDLLTGDVDDSISGAQQRAAATASAGASGDQVAGVEAEVGDADQLLAIEDALADFSAQRIVLVDPDGDLAAAAQRRFELPVSVLGRS